MSPRVLGPGAFFPYDADFKDLRKVYDITSQVATIRPYGAKFGKAVAIEPGITNVQTQTDFTTKLGGWNSASGHRPQDVVTLTDGWRRVPKIDGTVPGTANTEIFVDITYAVSVGQRYTEQFLFRYNGSQPAFDITFFTNNGHHAVAPTLTHLGKGVWHAMATYVIESGGTTLRAIDAIINSWGSSTYMDIIEPVVHLHTGVQASITSPIRTSHVWGTRSAGKLEYNGWLLPRNEGTISCWIRPNYDYSSFTNSWRDIFRATTTASSDEFRLTIGANSGDPGLLQVRLFAGGASQVSHNFDIGPWDPKLLHHMAFSWSDAEQVLYYNGVRRATRIGQFSRWTETALLYVGSNSVGSEFLDGLLDDLAIFPRQLTDAQVANIYA